MDERIAVLPPDAEPYETVLDVTITDPTSHWPIEVGLTAESYTGDHDMERHNILLSLEAARLVIEALQGAIDRVEGDEV